jgi:hypothetical protein
MGPTAVAVVCDRRAFAVAAGADCGLDGNYQQSTVSNRLAA